MMTLQTSVIGEYLESVLGVDPTYGDPIGYAIQGLAVLIVVYVLGRAVVVPLVNRAMTRRDLDPHARSPLLKLVFFIIVFVALAAGFAAAGRGNILTSLATIAAAATLAVGFALQDVLKNFVSGVFIFIDKPFRIGDWIEWDDHSGIVEDISLRVTRVRTFDNELLTVPNFQLTDNVVKNPVDAEKLRVKFEFGIGYDDDIEHATDIILEAAREHEGIMDDPAPSVRLTELGDSSVGLQARIWIANPSRSDFVKTRADYVTTVKHRFDEAGIDIPYPHQTLTGDISVADPHPDSSPPSNGD